MFFATKTSTPKDSYEKMQEIVQTLLLQECPEHRSQHHILYSANIRLAHIGEAREHFRTLIDPATPTGQYAHTAYEKTTTAYNELALLIRGYMMLCDEAERKRYNHNFLFSTEKIADCYTLFKERKTYEDVLPIEQSFWSALKQQLLPLLAQIT